MSLGTASSTPAVTGAKAETRLLLLGVRNTPPNRVHRVVSQLAPSASGLSSLCKETPPPSHEYFTQTREFREFDRRPWTRCPFSSCHDLPTCRTHALKSSPSNLTYTRGAGKEKSNSCLDLTTKVNDVSVFRYCVLYCVLYCDLESAKRNMTDIHTPNY